MITPTTRFERIRDFSFGLFCLLLYCVCTVSSVFIFSSTAKAHDAGEAIALGFIGTAVFAVSVFWARESLGFFLSVFSSWRPKA